MNVLVIYGGISSERDISLISGKNVGHALELAGHTVKYFDPASGSVSISNMLQDATFDVIFPILHGTGGEDGGIQLQLEQFDIPYVGSDSVTSKNCFDKWYTIQSSTGIKFPRSELVNESTIHSSQLITKPYVIKPRAEGSSIDTFLVHDPGKFDIQNLAKIFTKYNNELLLEELIDGQELTVGVVCDEALPVVEIIPPVGQEFDFINKYNGATTENCPPQFINVAIQQEAQIIAKNLHEEMGCRDFSRTDFIVDATGTLYALEINTLPGMTLESLLPRAAKAAGYSIETLVDMLVRSAFLRGE